MDLQLSDKTALVTGSSKGIGEAIAMALAREGASVVVHGRDGAQADRVVNAIVANGGRAYAVLGDLTHLDSTQTFGASTFGKQADGSRLAAAPLELPLTGREGGG
jgi:NAD(P)-dependent dehydrogenase (short-subunit alcohol dehydrogenase family)